MPSGSPPAGACVPVGGAVVAVAGGSPLSVGRPLAVAVPGSSPGDGIVSVGVAFVVSWSPAADGCPARSSPKTIATTAAAASSRAPRDHQATDADRRCGGPPGRPPRGPPAPGARRRPRRGPTAVRRAVGAPPALGPSGGPTGACGA